MLVFPRCFVIVLRDMGITNGGALLSLGITLIVATVAVFAHALWRTRTEVKELRQGTRRDTTTSTVDDEENRTGPPRDAAEATGDTRDLPDQPASKAAEDETEIEMAEFRTVAMGGRRETTEPNDKRSLWQMLGLCASESEGESEGDFPGTSASVDQTQIDEFAKLVAKLKRQEALLAQKDAEIARLSGVH